MRDDERVAERSIAREPRPMRAVPDLRRDQREQGSFDKDIPGIPSSSLRIMQDGLTVTVEFVAYENDVEVMRSSYAGRLCWWFPKASKAFVRLHGSEAVMAIDAVSGWYRFDLAPEVYVDDEPDAIRYDEPT